MVSIHATIAFISAENVCVVVVQCGLHCTLYFQCVIMCVI